MYIQNNFSDYGIQSKIIQTHTYIVFQKKLYRDFQPIPRNMKKSWEKSSCDRSNTDALYIQ